MATRTAAIALLACLMASGCTSEPQPREVNFADVDDSQSRADFTLRVKVVGVENGTLPLPGAFVGAAAGSQAIAKSTTGADGIAVLRVRSDQTIRVVAQATGWTTEDSGRLEIGTGGSRSAENCIVQMEATWCVVTGSDASEATRLTGDSASISITLFRSRVRQAADVQVDPHARLGSVALPDNRYWFPASKALHEDAAIERLYYLRLEKAVAKLTWRNELLSQGDFELGLGCQPNAPSRTSSSIVPYFAQQNGQARIDLEWSPSQKAGWSECHKLRAGPVVDSATSGASTHLDLELTFQGRSRIVPVAT